VDTLPTPEQTARAILAIFVHFNNRPGDILLFQNFMNVWAIRKLRTEDFPPGMQYAAERGWVEVLPGGAKFKLTRAGFVEARTVAN
jgi:hypothetical protein